MTHPSLACLLFCTCPPLCAGALWPMPAWVWRDIRSLFLLGTISPLSCQETHSPLPMSNESNGVHTGFGCFKFFQAHPAFFPCWRRHRTHNTLRAHIVSVTGLPGPPYHQCWCGSAGVPHWPRVGGLWPIHTSLTKLCCTQLQPSSLCEVLVLLVTAML